MNQVKFTFVQMIMQVSPINIYLRDAKLTLQATFDEIDLKLRARISHFRGRSNSLSLKCLRIAYKPFYVQKFCKRLKFNRLEVELKSLHFTGTVENSDETDLSDFEKLWNFI